MSQPTASFEPRLTPDDPRLQRLRGLIGDWPSRLSGDGPQPSPCPFDDLLGGVTSRRLVDLLAVGPGSGASLVGLWIASRACRNRGELVVIDGPGVFYPPAAFAWGVEAQRVLRVQPASSKDSLAAAEIALRSPAVGAVWASLGRIDGRAYRRLLLAAEAGGAMGVLVRGGRFASEASWADVQLLVEPTPTPADPDAPLLVKVTRRRNRHGPAGGEATLALDWRAGSIEDVTNPSNANDPPHPLPVAAGLAGTAKSA